MKPRNLAPRILAVVLSACLILPPHAYALRPQQQETEPQRTGLEEALRSGDPDALVRVASSRLAQWIAPAPAVSPAGLEEGVQYYFRKHLSQQEQSRNALPVDSFPRREGKINRRALLALLAAGSATALAGAWLVSQHPEKAQEKTVKKISPPMTPPGLPARPSGLAPIDHNNPHLQKLLLDLVNAIVSVGRESHSRRSVDLTSIVEAAKKINPQFTSSVSAEQLQDAQAKQLDLLWLELQVQVFIPAGELLFFTSDKRDGQSRPVRWSIDGSSWRRVPYLNSEVWLADVEGGDPARDPLLGITFGRLAFSHPEFARKQGASERQAVMDTPYPAGSTPGRLRSLLRGIAAEDYERYLGEGFVRHEEMRHAQDIAFAELRLRSDLSSDPRAVVRAVEVLLKPDSSLRKSVWEDVKEFRLDEDREERVALVLFEYAGQLGSAIKLIEALLESGQEDLAYAAFLRFVLIQTGAAQEGVGVMSQYALVGQLLVEHFRKMGFDMRFLINSLPRSLEAERGTPASAARDLLERIYQNHFWTDKERIELLKSSPAGLEEPLSFSDTQRSRRSFLRSFVGTTLGLLLPAVGSAQGIDYPWIADLSSNFPGEWGEWKSKQDYYGPNVPVSIWRDAIPFMVGPRVSPSQNRDFPFSVQFPLGVTDQVKSPVPLATGWIWGSRKWHDSKWRNSTVHLVIPKDDISVAEYSMWAGWTPVYDRVLVRLSSNRPMEIHILGFVTSGDLNDEPSLRVVSLREGLSVGPQPKDVILPILLPYGIVYGGGKASNLVNNFALQFVLEEWEGTLRIHRVALGQTLQAQEALKVWEERRRTNQQRGGVVAAVAAGVVTVGVAGKAAASRYLDGAFILPSPWSSPEDKFFRRLNQLNRVDGAITSLKRYSSQIPEYSERPMMSYESTSTDYGQEVEVGVHRISNPDSTRLNKKLMRMYSRRKRVVDRAALELLETRPGVLSEMLSGVLAGKKSYRGYIEEIRTRANLLDKPDLKKVLDAALAGLTGLWKVLTADQIGIVGDQAGQLTQRGVNPQAYLKLVPDVHQLSATSDDFRTNVVALAEAGEVWAKIGHEPAKEILRSLIQDASSPQDLRTKLEELKKLSTHENFGTASSLIPPHILREGPMRQLSERLKMLDSWGGYAEEILKVAAQIAWEEPLSRLEDRLGVFRKFLSSLSRDPRFSSGKDSAFSWGDFRLYGLVKEAISLSDQGQGFLVRFTPEVPGVGHFETETVKREVFGEDPNLYYSDYSSGPRSETIEEEVSRYVVDSPRVPARIEVISEKTAGLEESLWPEETPATWASPLSDLSPGEVHALAQRLKERAVSPQTLPPAVEGVRASSGVYVSSESPTPVVFLFDHPDTWGWAPLTAQAGAPVAVQVQTMAMASGLEELFRAAQIPAGRYVIVSLEQFGGDELAARRAIAERFSMEISLLRVPSQGGLEEAEAFLRQHGVVFSTNAAAGLEEVDRYLAGFV